MAGAGPAAARLALPLAGTHPAQLSTSCRLQGLGRRQERHRRDPACQPGWCGAARRAAALLRHLRCYWQLTGVTSGVPRALTHLDGAAGRDSGLGGQGLHGAGLLGESRSCREFKDCPGGPRPAASLLHGSMRWEQDFRPSRSLQAAKMLQIFAHGHRKRDPCAGGCHARPGPAAPPRRSDGEELHPSHASPLVPCFAPRTVASYVSARSAHLGVSRRPLGVTAGAPRGVTPPRGEPPPPADAAADVPIARPKMPVTTCSIWSSTAQRVGFSSSAEAAASAGWKARHSAMPSRRSTARTRRARRQAS